MVGLRRLLTLVALLAFAAAALRPVAVVHVERAPATRSAELAGGRPTAAHSALVAAAGAGPRAIDLVLRDASRDAGRAAARPGALPAGPLGAQAISAVEALPVDPSAIELRALRPPAVGRPAALALGCDGPLPAGTSAAVTVRAGEADLLRATVVLEAGRPAELTFVPLRAGPVTVEVEVGLADQTVVRSGELDVAPAAPVLVLEPSGVAAAALAAQGVGVERAGAMAADLSRYAAAVVGAPLVSPLQQQLAAAVDDGLGLFVLAPAFGAATEPLHELLPVVPEPDPRGAGGGPAVPAPAAPEPSPPNVPDDAPPPAGEIVDPAPVSSEPVEVDKRSIDMVLVVDRSNSMGRRVRGGAMKMSYAKTSALETALALTAGDRVGVVTFGIKDGGRVELPMTDATDLGGIRDAVERLAHGDLSTNLLSGLQRADELLAGSQAAVKHVVVITDGEFDTTETNAMRRLAHRMRTVRGISTSIISIVTPGALFSGRFKSDAKAIATLEGGGAFLEIEGAEEIPKFVSSEVTRSLERVGRRPGNRPGDRNAPLPPPEPEPERPEPEPPEPEPREPARLPVRAVATSPVLEPLPREWPSLGAAVATTAPLDAQVLLVAGDQGWPLLAYGNRGLGRVGAFAADLCGEPGAELRAERHFPARLALWVQHVMRAEPVGEPRRIPMTTRVVPGAPTPAEVAALERLAGTRASPSPVPAPPAHARQVRSRIPDWAIAALGVLLLLALAERVAVLRGRA